MRTTYIYFAQDPSGPIKIGWSQDPEKRVRGLRHNGQRPKLLATLESHHGTEQKLHLCFRHARIDGEWFSPTVALVELIRESGGAACPPFIPDTATVVPADHGCSFDTFSARIRRLMAISGATRDDMVRICDLSCAGDAWLLQHGCFYAPNDSVTARVATGFGVSVEWLFWGLRYGGKSQLPDPNVVIARVNSARAQSAAA